jgi:hypothetical protein
MRVTKTIMVNTQKTLFTSSTFRLSFGEITARPINSMNNVIIVTQNENSAYDPILVMQIIIGRYSI